MEAVQWEKLGKGFTPCSGTEKSLPGGVYTVVSTQAGLVFQPKKLSTDDLLRFEDPTHQEIIGEINNFWALKPKYSKLGFLHNRALLMWGPPGSGKSCISKIVVADVVNMKNIVLNCDDIYLVSGALNAIREVEPQRQIMVLMEDIDSLRGEGKLLSLLDGEDTVDNILYLCTTNYIDRIPERVLRPGRIDRRISVPCPPRAGRIAFLKSKIGGPITGDDNNSAVINRLADATDGLSFAHLRELLVGVYCLGHKPEEVIKRLKNKGAEELTKQSIKAMDRKISVAMTKKDKRMAATASVTKMPEQTFKITKAEVRQIKKRRASK
jgi:SpoVK/Ycf46/Vps4 family AAA+-type ATPase